MPADGMPHACSPNPSVNFIVYLPANGLKITVYPIIRKTQDFKAVFLKHFRPFLIVRRRIRFPMLGSVQLNHQFGGMTVIVGDKSLYCFLPLESHGIFPQEVISQVFFLRRRFFRSSPARGISMGS